MAPRTDVTIYETGTETKKTPATTADDWIEEKKALDGAEGLWRVHDNIYDLSSFIKKHPGGEFWLSVTQGTDITEAFESHHISTGPEGILQKYYVRKAKIPRRYPFTFEENGFYRTLKRNVRKVLKDVPEASVKTSKVFTDILLAGSFVFAILASTSLNYMLGFFSGVLLASATIAAHNFVHRKDNFRMYYSDIGMMQSREWRVMHVLSHHLYPNTSDDILVTFVWPNISLYPHKKSLLLKYGSWLSVVAFMWPTCTLVLFFSRIFRWVVQGHSKCVTKADLLVIILPTLMYLFSRQAVASIALMWLFIMVVNSFCYCFIGMTSAHYHPDIFMEGDKPRSKDEMDWGISQLDTVSDRQEITGNHLLVLVTFGDHALHHLFPTLDHGVLQHLYPVVEETMKQFNLGIRMTTQADMMLGLFRQLARDKPNPNFPNLRIKKS